MKKDSLMKKKTTGQSFNKISVLIPCYNEEQTIKEIVDRVHATNVGLEIEIIIVNDGSADKSKTIINKLAKEKRVKSFHLPKNMGKGAAIALALEKATGDIIVIQDADLEYDPADFSILLKPIVQGKSKVVYGSRFLGEHKAMYFWHSVGNRFLTLLTNVLYDTTLTDMETGYKVITADIAKNIRLSSPRWGFDPEITARILLTGARIYEVPITYAGRDYTEGKKITWRDGFIVMITLLRCRLFG